MSLSIQPEEQRSITVRAPAKINLAPGRRPAGRRRLPSARHGFQAVGLYDDVRATDRDGTVTVEPAAYLPGDVLADLADQRDNNVVRAGRLSRPPRTSPGSPWSTCASRNASPSPGGWPAARPTPRPRWSRGPDVGPGHRGRRLLELAARLGSDGPSRCSAAPRTAPGAVSACTRSATAPRGGGSWCPAGRDCRLRRSTPVRRDVPRRPGHPRVLGRRRRRAVVRTTRNLAAALHNDLEAPAIDLRPELGDLIAHGEAEGALRGLVSGSGPTVVFLCESGDHARALADRLQGDDLPVVLVANGPVAGATWRALMANLVNLERVSKAYGVRPLLADVSLGVAEGERIGVVGRNGDGKTTLLEVMTGQEPPDSGRVSSTRGMLVGFLHQHDALVDTHSVREAVLAGRADHEWAADPRTREIVEELLAGVTLDRAVLGLSGGERRRCALAALLLGDHDMIVLDEPTNHLDVEAVDWLARHLAARPSALVVVTHDRWFLDAVCQWTWEVHDGAVDAYEGGYAAYILAKAERQRQASATEERRENLVRKELAWLRRGPPARTSKPKFRIDAANSLIEDVPPPRDRFELQRFAAQRLGKDVLDVEDVDLVRGEQDSAAPRHLAARPWRQGRHRRGQRGRQDLGARPARRVDRTVRGAGPPRANSLAAAPDPGPRRPRPGRSRAATLESVKRVTRTATGEITATSMLERFGFSGDRLTTRIGDCPVASGGASSCCGC